MSLDLKTLFHCVYKNGVYYLQLLHSIISISKTLFKWPPKTNQDLVNDPQQNGLAPVTGNKQPAPNIFGDL